MPLNDWSVELPLPMAIFLARSAKNSFDIIEISSSARYCRCSHIFPWPIPHVPYPQPIMGFWTRDIPYARLVCEISWWDSSQVQAILWLVFKVRSIEPKKDRTETGLDWKKPDFQLQLQPVEHCDQSQSYWFEIIVRPVKNRFGPVWTEPMISCYIGPCSHTYTFNFGFFFIKNG